jgi:hypothetical protein
MYFPVRVAKRPMSDNAVLAALRTMGIPADVIFDRHISRGDEERHDPAVGAVWMTYRRSLPLLARFTLTSRMVCWDERWFYIEQSFTGSQGLAARGWVRGLLRSAEGNLDPQEVMEAVSPGAMSPPVPESIAMWNELMREKLQSGG